MRRLELAVLFPANKEWNGSSDDVQDIRCHHDPAIPFNLSKYLQYGLILASTQYRHSSSSGDKLPTLLNACVGMEFYSTLKLM